jgi:hypothetical protein
LIEPMVTMRDIIGIVIKKVPLIGVGLPIRPRTAFAASAWRHAPRTHPNSVLSVS